MKALLVIITMFVTLGSTSAYAGAEEDARRERAKGVFSAIADFLSSVFGGGEDDGTAGDDAGSGGTAGAGAAGAASDAGASAAMAGGEDSVPAIQDNDSSAEFIAAQIAAETGWSKEKMMPYSTRLAKTLSQLSAKEQAEVFYGSGGL